MRGLQRYWSQGTISKIVVLVVAGAIVLVGCFAIILSAGALIHNGASGQGTGTPASTLRPAPTATPVIPPALGAPLAAFSTAYGHPTLTESLGATDDFWGDKLQTILIGVALTSGRATSITILGPSTSNLAQTYAECQTFLPSGATSYSSSPPNTLFHSTLGNLVLENDNNGLCRLYVASPSS
jgi:hypothetical protein